VRQGSFNGKLSGFLGNGLGVKQDLFLRGGVYLNHGNARQWATNRGAPDTAAVLADKTALNSLKKSKDGLFQAVIDPA
jgi:hypothetical protein